MSKKLLSAILAIIMLATITVPAFARGTDIDAISDDIFTELNMEYSNLTQTYCISFVPARDIVITALKYFDADDVSALDDYGFSGDLKNDINGVCNAFSEARTAAADLASACKDSATMHNEFFVDTYTELGDMSIAEYFTENPDELYPATNPIGLEIDKWGFESVLSEDYYDRGRYETIDNDNAFENLFSDDALSIMKFNNSTNATMISEKAVEIWEKLDLAYYNLEQLFNAASSEDQESIIEIFGDNMWLNFEIKNAEFNLSTTTAGVFLASYLHEGENFDAVGNFLSDIINAVSEDEDYVITLEAGKEYKFAKDYSGEEIAFATDPRPMTLTADFNVWETADDGSKYMHNKSVVAEEVFCEILGIEDGSWVESEEPIVFTAQGIDHFFSAAYGSARNSMIPLRWYLNGEADKATDFENGEYTVTLNDGRMKGDAYSLTVVFAKESLEYPDIVVDDTVTEEVTISFTANTFKFAEVFSLLALIESKIMGIINMLIGLIGA